MQFSIYIIMESSCEKEAKCVLGRTECALVEFNHGGRLLVL